MPSPVWINRGKPYWSINIELAEKKYNATYIGDFCLDVNHNSDKPKNWTEQPFAVFWQENPQPGHNHYFGLYIRDGFVYITNATSAAEGHWDGMVADDGEIIYSRFRHDFRESTDHSVIVDGGRDYFKHMGKIDNPRVKITIVRDKLVVNDTLILPTSPP